MIASKVNALKPLIDSNEGPHLTAYLTNDKSIFDLRRQLEESISIGYEYLAPVMNPEALIRFMAPMHSAVHDTKLLKGLKGNVGIFRNENSFRMLSLPVSIEQTCIVATSFHIKPLLSWIQSDKDFLLLGIGEGFANLYQGNKHNLNLIDTILFRTENKTTSGFDSYADLKIQRNKKLMYDDTVLWINEWIENMNNENSPPLFIAGSQKLTEVFIKQCRYKNLKRNPIWPSFTDNNVDQVCTEIRTKLAKESKEKIDHALMEFNQAEDINIASKNIFHIASAAVKGRVLKLIIADDISIFGTINKTSGELSIHPRHLNHEDDDVLDDLAQEVLAHGGEVIIVSRSQIPKGRPILAILERNGNELAMYNRSMTFTEVNDQGRLV